MIKIEGHEIWRNGAKVGYIEGDKIRDHEGRKLGYFSESHVLNNEGRKIAYISGNYLCTESGTEVKVSLDKVNENIEGGLLTEIGKCAVYALIGI